MWKCTELSEVQKTFESSETPTRVLTVKPYGTALEFRQEDGGFTTIERYRGPAPGIQSLFSTLNRISDVMDEPIEKILRGFESLSQEDKLQIELEHSRMQTENSIHEVMEARKQFRI